MLDKLREKVRSLLDRGELEFEIDLFSLGVIFSIVGLTLISAVLIIVLG